MNCTYKEAIKILDTILKQRNIPNGTTSLDLLTTITHKKNIELIANVDKTLTRLQAITLNSYINSIENNIPIAYIIHNKYFYGDNYLVSNDTLIPRPETELVVELVIKFLESINTNNEITSFEVGTGTGCIPIAILNNTTHPLKFFSTDISDRTLSIARKNRFKLLKQEKQKHLQFRKQDFFKTLPKMTFDLIISNPPYIAHNEYYKLPESVLREPIQALTDNEDGLKFYRRIAMVLPKLLKPKGRLIVEVHSEKSKEVLNIFSNTLTLAYEAKVHKDLFQRNRVIEITLTA